MSGVTSRHKETVPIEETGEGVYRTFYDTAKGDVTVTVTLALASVADIDTTKLVSEWINYADPDALDHLFRERPNGDRRHPDGRVHLSIEGIDVTIHSDGLIELEP